MTGRKATKLTLASSQALEVRALSVIDQLAHVDNADDLEEAAQYVRWVVEMMVEQGYHPVAAEGFALHGRRAAAAAQVRLGLNVQGAAPPGANVHGLNAGHYRSRLTNMVSILSTYTPAELSRELSRLARSADPRVLQEDEFQ